MREYDKNVPLILKQEQDWFGSIISRPIDQESRMEPVSPTGQSMEEEAAYHIIPSPTLRPAQRIQIYNQQYWWRLLNTLHEIFPLVVRLFGYVEFNRLIGIPYLVKYPPRHWSLAQLGDRLSLWCLEEYQEIDKKLVSQAAHLDWGFSNSFTVRSLPSLRIEDLSMKEEEKLFLQPHLVLFELEYDLLRYRVDFLKEEPDYWIDHEFPILHSRGSKKGEKEYHILYRNAKNEISWKHISSLEYQILILFQKGATLQDVCNWLENLDADLQKNANEHLQEWFQEWAARGWLSLMDPNF